jgi:hypothetical protein
MKYVVDLGQYPALKIIFAVCQLRKKFSCMKIFAAPRQNVLVV